MSITGASFAEYSLGPNQLVTLEIFRQISETVEWPCSPYQLEEIPRCNHSIKEIYMADAGG